jgi:hypothetical protein
MATVKKAMKAQKGKTLKTNPVREQMNWDEKMQRSKSDTIQLNPPYPRKGGKLIIPKSKKGGSFDLNKDGKTTFKDVLIGRGVLPKTAKKGMKVKKAKDGKVQPMGNATKVGEGKYKSEDGNYKMKFKGGSEGSDPKIVQRRTLKGFLSGAPRGAGKKSSMKMGGKMSKSKIRIR